MPIKTSKMVALLVILFFLFFCLVYFSKAQTTDEINSKLNSTNDAIQKLNKEINQYQTQIDAIGNEKDTLSNTIKSLDISKKKLQANTKITQDKIDEKNLEIKELSKQIVGKNDAIIDSKRVISQSFYNISQMDSLSMIETILSEKSISDIWNDAEKLNTLQGSMQEKIKEFNNLKTNLEKNKTDTEKKKAELVNLQSDLKNQMKIIAETEAEKNSILAETKNTEAGYIEILAEKQAQKEAFEKEVLRLESSMKFTLDPNSIPRTGTGILKYPLDKIRITQYFGNTEYSTKNPSVYNGSGHNGIDFAASIGTAVKSAGSGEVTNVIRTRVNQRCGYGNWVVIRHDNGLSTLYAHLSLATVNVGDHVYTGQTLGYSGNTGFTTGPHLHFGVYVTNGLKTIESKSCPGIIIPYAAFNAYLNPLSYL